ncbi:dienelactone hydrolase family protein [Hypoxylon sp. FL1284]|nr:dienelactone hydrolase family protein [Hypoxylon sp. FL1284]
MSMSECCLTGFQWSGTPSGKEGKLGKLDAYITGDNPDAAIMMVHDAFGWTFSNCRLMADHLAREVGATVYLPDFFMGEVVDPQILLSGEFHKFDFKSFLERNGRAARDAEVLDAARALRALQFKKVGAVGYCYGGWAVFRLGAREHSPPLVDCIATGHPSLLTPQDIDEVAVPVQILAPEHDPVYTAELKAHTLTTLPTLGIPWDYRHYPGVSHGAFIRGVESTPGERSAMVSAKNAAVHWFREYLH